ncbi:MAG: hypothetical protein LAT80_14965 [Balneolaceae bacterium]|nr:hypothetical protein [Balneolaceae bacterium]
MDKIDRSSFPDQNSLKDFSNSYGDAFYLFDKDKFESNLKTFRDSFEKHYGNVRLAYSLKTNYIPQVCETAREQGALAEVVSGEEYRVARNVGFKGTEIIFNGPVKFESDLFRAFKEGALVQIDSWEEIPVIKSFLKANPSSSIRCAVRCNFRVDDSSFSRFGIDVESGELQRVFEELFSIERCSPVGIHCHFSTRKRSVKSYLERTRKLIQLSGKIFKDKRPEYINIGGGFFGELPKEYQKNYSFHIPSKEEYGEAVSKLMKISYPEEDVQLILEPGTAVVADTMHFICRVHSVKNINNRKVVTVTGSLHNIRPTSYGMDIPFKTVRCSDKPADIKDGVIAGYTCMETDIINQSFNGELGVGDYLKFSNVGAYNIVFKPPFIHGAPPIVMLKRDGSNLSQFLIRDKESLEDFTEKFLSDEFNTD